MSFKEKEPSWWQERTRKIKNSDVARDTAERVEKDVRVARIIVNKNRVEIGPMAEVCVKHDHSLTYRGAMASRVKWQQ